MKWLLPIVLILLLGPSLLPAQVTGGTSGSSTSGRHPISDDTLFVFTPARPLIDSTSIKQDVEDVIGFDLLFSNSGFGVGGFYQHNYSQNLAGFINLGVTGSRKSDEFEKYDNTAQDYLVPGKINRLFTLPLMVGIRYRLLDEVLVDNFRPFFNIGAGPSMIVALPYQYSFFTSFGHARAYFTGGGFVGIGAEVGGRKPLLSVNIRYFYIPFKPGLESLQNESITDFGGLFLTMNVGFN